ncbi:mannose-6-phosphate isomerase, class I [Cellulomonas soli]|uniref:mannose-6-phosphate isomerase n=1 Tax=Cellulomonas soli TaxID=931535 RepID=A0A512P859_9CELL|nr:mannose-6-phosphate isomerase, class I [Cellulomonas soli]NYI57593.1 mannose-6-phosphate isomerase [Cellulomonas soli]GEP67370.1 mannose-6-phosphate isomerase [Cellulomonas soli]
MYRLSHVIQHYAWGSTTAIPDVLGLVPDGLPVAEAWFGAHASAPATVLTEHGNVPLDQLLVADPVRHLGSGVTQRFGEQLPYLLKLISAETPLSLQVHPAAQRAREGFAREDAAGIPRSAPHRSYRDANHKPELVYALTRFDAMVGFRAPRRAAELLDDLDTPLAADLAGLLMADATSSGVRAAFEWLLDPRTRPGAAEVQAFAEACARRLAAGSPSPRTDRTVMRLAASHPGDAGAVTSVLLNPVTLEPGEALFVPAGSVHAYLHGLGVEIMANSDNVLRAGLTGKHVDVVELLANLDCAAAPPIRIAPERVFTSTEIFYAPVDDFELSFTRLNDGGTIRVPGRGPRIVLCLEGEVEIASREDGVLMLARGQAAFVSSADGPLTARGDGQIVQADVP